MHSTIYPVKLRLLIYYKLQNSLKSLCAIFAMAIVTSC